MKKIEDLKDLEEKKILIRLDLNVPLKNGYITDTTRIEKILPTLKFLIKKNCYIVIISHIGRPKGRVVKHLSMRPVCDYLSKKLEKKIKLVEDDILKIDPKLIFKGHNEKIVMLENIRFYEQEEENDEKFAKILSKFGDIFVNDAFSCSHREHASVAKITYFLPSYCGLQMNIEVSALKKVTSEIERPITCIVGGSKISTKISVLKNLIPKFENVIIVGGMANNILEYKGYKIGKSIKENNCKEIIDEIFSLAKINNCNIFYPIDVSVGKNFNDSSKTKNLSNIEDDDYILDIGPKTIDEIVSIIKKSKTILWNGPAGYFENSNFAVGSHKIANTIVKSKGKIFSVVGGGDTIAVLNEVNILNQFDFVSTAGGAFLEYLEGKEIPGIRALN